MKLFVWDLHGTLEQGNEYAVVELSNLVLASHGYSKRFDSEIGRQLYGLKWYQYFENLLPEEGHAVHLKLQSSAFDLSNSATGERIILKHMQPSRNSHTVLTEIARRHAQIVISNTHTASLPLYIKRLNMQAYFGQANSLAVFSHTRSASGSKTSSLARYLKGNKFDELIVIGDSTGDMELAETFKATSYLYAHEGLEFRSDKGMYKINDLKLVLNEL